MLRPRHELRPLDLSKLSLADLKSLQTQLPKEIASRQKEERAKLLTDLEAMASERGFDFAELMGTAGRKNVRS